MAQHSIKKKVIIKKVKVPKKTKTEKEETLTYTQETWEWMNE